MKRPRSACDVFIDSAITKDEVSGRCPGPLGLVIDFFVFTFLALGALVAGFVNGFAGFGTALVASGFWFLVLPPQIVPPLIIVSALAGQIVGLWKLSGTMRWGASSYLISGGLIGVPIGAALLMVLEPQAVKVAIGCFLIAYCALQFKGLPDIIKRPHQDGMADRLVGFVGGIFGGFTGLSGPFPLIWLQLNKLSPTAQRERYQPFNLLVLGFATVAMGLIGKLDMALLTFALVAVPCSLIGAAIGVRVFVAMSEQLFQRAVLALLFLSGCAILAQTILGPI